MAQLINFLLLLLVVVASPLSVSSVLRVNIAPTGSHFVTIIGSLASSTSGASCGGTNSEAAFWGSSSTLTTKCSFGSSASATIQISSASVPAASLTQSISFSRPTFLNQGGNAPTTGSTSVTVLLSGHTSLSASTRISLTSPESTSWTSNSAIGGKIIRIFGKTTTTLQITFSGKSTSLSLAFSFFKIQIDSKNSTPLNSPSTASVSVTLLVSTGFGSSDQTARCRIQGTASRPTLWSSDSALSMKTCTVGTLGRKSSVIATVTAARASATALVSFDTVSAIFLQPLANTPATGSKSLSLVALNLAGVRGWTSACAVGKTATGSSLWVSSTSLRLKPCSASRLPAICISSQLSAQTLTQAISLDATRITPTFALNGPITGATTCTTLGRNVFAATYNGKFGVTGLESTIWSSVTSLRAKVSSGSGLKLGFIVTASASFLITQTSAFTRDSDLRMTDLSVQNSPSTGAILVSIITSSSLGISDFSVVCRLGGLIRGGTGSEFAQWVSDSLLILRVPSGILGSRSMIATLEKTYSATSIFSYSGGFGTVRGLGSPSQSNAPNTGGNVVAVVGLDIGTTSDVSARVSLSRTQGEQSQWVTVTAIASRMPARRVISSAFKSLILTMEKSTMSTLTSVFSNADSTVPTRLGQSNIAVTTASASLTISGFNFRLLDCTLTSRFARSGSEATYWQSTTSLPARQPGISTRPLPQNPIAISVSSSTSKSPLISLLSRSFTFDTFPLSLFSSTNSAVGPTTGGVAVTIFTTGGLGTSTGASPCGYIALSATESTLWVADTSATVKIVSGVAALVRIGLTVAVRVPLDGFRRGSPPTASFLAFTPHVIQMNNIPVVFPTTGAVQTTIICSAGLGRADSSSTLRLGPSSNPSSVWRSETSLTSKAHRSFPYSISSSPALTNARLVASAQNSFSYQPPDPGVWTQIFVSESNRIVNSTSSVLIGFSASIPLETDQRITISGLQNAQLPRDQINFPIALTQPDSFSMTAALNFSLNSIELTLTGGRIAVGTLALVSLVLRNPVVPLTPVPIFINGPVPSLLPFAEMDGKILTGNALVGVFSKLETSFLLQRKSPAFISVSAALAAPIPLTITISINGPPDVTVSPSAAIISQGSRSPALFNLTAGVTSGRLFVTFSVAPQNVFCVPSPITVQVASSADSRALFDNLPTRIWTGPAATAVTLFLPTPVPASSSITATIVISSTDSPDCLQAVKVSPGSNSVIFVAGTNATSVGFVLSQPLETAPGTVTVTYTLDQTSSSLGYIPPPPAIVTFKDIPTVTATLPSKMFLREKRNITVSLSEPVSTDLSWAIQLGGTGALGSVAFPSTIRIPAGGISTQFSLWIGTSLPSLTIALVGECQADAIVALLAAALVTLSLPIQIRFSITSGPLYSNNLNGIGTFVLGVPVPPATALSIQVQVTDAAQRISVAATTALTGDTATTFAIPSISSPGPTTFSFTLHGSAAFAFTAPPSLTVSTLPHKNIFYGVIGGVDSVLYFNEAAPLSLRLSEVIPLGLSLTVSLSLAGPASLGASFIDVATGSPISSVIFTGGMDSAVATLMCGGQRAGNFSVTLGVTGEAATSYSLNQSSIISFTLREKGNLVGIFPNAISPGSAAVPVQLLFTPAIPQGRGLTVEMVATDGSTAEISQRIIIAVYPEPKVPEISNGIVTYNYPATSSVSLPLTSSSLSGSLYLQFILSGDGAAVYNLPAMKPVAVVPLGSLGLVLPETIFVGEFLTGWVYLAENATAVIDVSFDVSSPSDDYILVVASPALISVGSRSLSFNLTAGSASGPLVLSVRSSLTVGSYVSQTIYILDPLEIVPSVPSEVAVGSSVKFQFTLSSELPPTKYFDLILSLSGAPASSCTVTSPLTFRQGSTSAVGSLETFAGITLGLLSVTATLAGVGARFINLKTTVFDVVVTGKIILSAPSDVIIGPSGSSNVNISVTFIPAVFTPQILTLQTDFGSLSSRGSPFSRTLDINAPAGTSSIIVALFGESGSVGVATVSVSAASFYLDTSPIVITFKGSFSLDSFTSTQSLSSTTVEPIRITPSIPIPSVDPLTGDAATLNISVFSSGPDSTTSSLLISPSFFSLTEDIQDFSFYVTTPAVGRGSFSIHFVLGGNLAIFFQPPKSALLQVTTTPIITAPPALSVGVSETVQISLESPVPADASASGGLTINIAGDISINPSGIILAAGASVATFSVSTRSRLSLTATLSYSLSGYTAYFSPPAPTIFAVASGISVVVPDGPIFVNEQKTLKFAIGIPISSADARLTISILISGLPLVGGNAVITYNSASFTLSTGPAVGTATISYELSGPLASSYATPQPNIISVLSPTPVAVNYPSALLTGDMATVTLVLPAPLPFGTLRVLVDIQSGDARASPSSVRFKAGDFSKNFSMSVGYVSADVIIGFALDGKMSSRYSLQTHGIIIRVDDSPLSISATVRRERSQAGSLMMFHWNFQPSRLLSRGDSIKIINPPLEINSIPPYIFHDSKYFIGPAEVDTNSNSITFEVSTDGVGPPLGLAVDFAGVSLAASPDVTVILTTSTGSASYSFNPFPPSRHHSPVQTRDTSTFLTRTISESTSIRGAVNTITVTLQCTLDIPAGGRLTLSGFTNSPTILQSSLPVFGDEAASVGGTARWLTDGVSGTLVLTVTSALRTSVRPVEFKFNLLNPLASQSLNIITLSVFGVPLPAASLDGNILGAGLSPRNLVTGTVTQSSNVAGSDNILTFRLRAKQQLTQGSFLTLRGLFPTDSHSVVLGGPEASVFGSAGIWRPDQGAFLLTIGGGQKMAVTTDTVFTLAFRNPTLFSPSGSTISVSVGGTSPALPSPLSGSAFLVSQSPLPFFKYFFATETSNVAGGENIMTFRFQSSVDIAIGSSLVIGGLGSSSTPSTASLPIKSSPAFAPSATAQWNRETGVLTISPTISAILSTVPVSVSVALASPSILSSGSSPRIASLAATIIPQKPCSDTILVSTQPTAKVLTASVKQSTLVQGARNTITISFSANIQLAAGATITVGGLTGVSRPVSTPSLPLTPVLNPQTLVSSGNSASLATGAWDRSQGTLVVSLVGSLPLRQELAFSFDLYNPYLSPNPQNQVTIRASRFSESLIVAVAPPDVLTTNFLSGSAGGGILEASIGTWLTAILAGSPTNSAGGTCIFCPVSLYLQPSVTLSQGSKIIISGILSSSTLTNGLLTIDDTTLNANTTESSIFGGRAVWNQTAGTLTLSVSIGRNISAGRLVGVRVTTLASPPTPPQFVSVSLIPALIPTMQLLVSGAFVSRVSPPKLVAVSPLSLSVSPSRIFSLTFDQNIFVKNTSTAMMSLYSCSVGSTPTKLLGNFMCNNESVVSAGGGPTLQINITAFFSDDTWNRCVFLLLPPDCVTSSLGQNFIGVSSSAVARYYVSGGRGPELVSTVPSNGSFISIGTRSLSINFTTAISLASFKTPQVFVLGSTGRLIAAISATPSPLTPSEFVDARDSILFISFDPTTIATAGEIIRVSVTNGSVISPASGVAYSAPNVFTFFVGGSSGTLSVGPGLWPVGLIGPPRDSDILTLQLPLVGPSGNLPTAIVVGSGVVMIYRIGAGVDSAVPSNAIAVISARSVSVTGNIVSIPVSFSLLQSATGPSSAIDRQGFFVRISPVAFSAAALIFDGLPADNAWRFWVTSESGSAPRAVAFVPKISEEVSSGNIPMVVTFNRVVDLGIGEIRLVASTLEASTLVLLSVRDTARVKLSNTVLGNTTVSQISFSVEVPAVPNLPLQIEISPGAVTADGIPFSGLLSGQLRWSFRVKAPPVLISTFPVDPSARSVQVATLTDQVTTVTFPPGSLPVGTGAISISSRGYVGATPSALSYLAMESRSDLFDFEPDGTSFLLPVHLCLKSACSIVASGKSRRLAKRVVDAGTGVESFNPIPTTDAAPARNCVVCASVTSFSSYMVVDILQIAPIPVATSPQTTPTPPPATPAIIATPAPDSPASFPILEVVFGGIGVLVIVLLYFLQSILRQKRISLVRRDEENAVGEGTEVLDAPDIEASATATVGFAQIARSTDSISSPTLELSVSGKKVDVIAPFLAGRPPSTLEVFEASIVDEDAYTLQVAYKTSVPSLPGQSIGGDVDQDLDNYSMVGSQVFSL